MAKTFVSQLWTTLRNGADNIERASKTGSTLKDLSRLIAIALTGGGGIAWMTSGGYVVGGLIVLCVLVAAVCVWHWRRRREGGDRGHQPMSPSRGTDAGKRTYVQTPLSVLARQGLPHGSDASYRPTTEERLNNQRCCKIYVGAWVRISLVLKSIALDSDHVEVTCQEEGGLSISCRFCMDWRESLLHYVVGDQLHLHGQIAELNVDIARLDNCELS